MPIQSLCKHIVQSLALILNVSFSLAEIIPAAEFGKLPSIHSISISLDGNKLVALRAKGDTYHAVVTDLVAKKSRLVLAADPDQSLFDWCRFANETRIICMIRKYGAITETLGEAEYFFDNRRIFNRLIAVDLDGTNVLQLVPPTRSTVRGENRRWNADDQSDVIR